MKKALLFFILVLLTGNIWAQKNIQRTTYDYAIKGQDTLKLDVYLDANSQV